MYIIYSNIVTQYSRTHNLYFDIIGVYGLVFQSFTCFQRWFDFLLNNLIRPMFYLLFVLKFK